MHELFLMQLEYEMYFLWNLLTGYFTLFCMKVQLPQHYKIDFSVFIINLLPNEIPKLLRNVLFLLLRFHLHLMADKYNFNILLFMFCLFLWC